MKTRRAFLFNGAVNLAAILAGGSLVLNGKEQFKKAVKNLEGQQEHVPENLQAESKKYTIDDGADFAVGGTLGFITKKNIEAKIELRQKSKESDRVNEELISLASKLQKLEKTDLPGIERILKEFIRKEGITYEADNNADSVTSIRNLFGAILIHVDAYKKAVQSFLEELKMLRGAIVDPFTKQLQNTAVDAAAQELFINVLRGDKLVECVRTFVIKALHSDATGEKIGKKTVSCLADINPISEAGVVAFKKAVTDILESSPFKEALSETMCTAIIEYNIADKLVSALISKFKISIKDNDPDLIALKNALAESIKCEKASSTLNDAVYNALSDPNIIKRFVQILQRLVAKKSLNE